MQIKNEIFFEQVEQLLATGNEVTLLIRGHSMRPWLRDQRDTITIAPVHHEEMERGAVVLFRYKKQHILHRILERNDDALVLAGDGNYRIREYCTTHDVVGKLIQIRRPSGRVIRCDSRRWRWQSKFWLSLHPFVRRMILGLMRRMKLG